MGRYTDVHAEPKGPGDARPTAFQIIQDEGLQDRLKGKVMVITGSTAGIGLETARALSATGATLFLTVRDLDRARKTLSSILEPGRVLLVLMNNDSLASVKAAAATILALSQNQVNILICNAAILGGPERQITIDGHEMHFAVNYLSHFFLFQLLKPALLASASPTFASRVVMVASSAYRACTLSPADNYHFEKGGYEPFLAYAQSKLATIYLANEIERRYGSKGLHATSLHPGTILTKLFDSLGPEAAAMVAGQVKPRIKSCEQGAATTVLAAVGKEWENKGGRYLEDCEEAGPGEENNDVLGQGYVQQTYDPHCEARLWQDSLKMVGMEDAELGD
ncbi:short-chain dehydrogenase [Aspergillus falconensis]